MKKILNKLRKPSARKQAVAPARITNDTVAEHRQRVIAGGRKFKYPIQYARHKLVINTIIISILALILIVALGWWQLYSAQNTSGFMYRVTRVLPLPVASVDGDQVRYSDYLMSYRGEEYYLSKKNQENMTPEDKARQLDYIKRQAIDGAVASTFAAKVAREKDITVTGDELDAFLKEQRQSPDGEISQQTYEAVIADYYDWSASEYRDIMGAKLLQRKVAYAIDTVASETLSDVQEKIGAAEAPDFAAIADTYKNSDKNVIYGVSGWVPRTNQDGGLAAAAAKLEKGAISQPIQTRSGDGYYVLRLVDSNDTQVSYEYIKIQLTEFKDRLARLKQDGNISYYIEIPEQTAAQAAPLPEN